MRIDRSSAEQLRTTFRRPGRHRSGAGNQSPELPRRPGSPRAYQTMPQGWSSSRKRSLWRCHATPDPESFNRGSMLSGTTTTAPTDCDSRRGTSRRRVGREDRMLGRLFHRRASLQSTATVTTPRLRLPVIRTTPACGRRCAQSTARGGPSLRPARRRGSIPRGVPFSDERVSGSG